MIVGAEGDPRDSFANAARYRWKTTRAEIGPISRDTPPIELFPIENSFAFHVDEHIAIYLIIRFARFIRPR